MWYHLYVILIFGAVSTTANTDYYVVKTFTSVEDVSKMRFNHLVVDQNSGRVFIGAVNRIYQLSPDLDVTDWVSTGPVNDSADCALDCSGITPKDNVNKVLVIDYSTNRLIACGSVHQGSCSVRNVNFISRGVREIQHPVVANDAKSSTVAFIAPGPINSSLKDVMYVGVTFTGNSPHRYSIPSISSRSLENDHLFMIADTSVAIGTKIFVSSMYRESYPINYVYGFSSEGFSYFLTTQLTEIGSNSYYSKLVRICHDDPAYYSYTEVPISCGSNYEYNLVQAAFVGKPGSILAEHLGITVQDDVLFTVFSRSQSSNSDQPSEDASSLCVYSLKSIRQKFSQNINDCFRGHGSRGLDYITPSSACIGTKLAFISEYFCGMDVNTPLGGKQPVEALPVAVFNKRLTAVAATEVGNSTVLFAGTAEGHLKKIVMENASVAFEYADIIIDEGSPVNKDLFFDTQCEKHLYVMTERKISKVKVQKCST